MVCLLNGAALDVQPGKGAQQLVFALYLQEELAEGAASHLGGQLLALGLQGGPAQAVELLRG